MRCSVTRREQPLRSCRSSSSLVPRGRTGMAGQLSRNTTDRATQATGPGKSPREVRLRDQAVKKARASRDELRRHDRPPPRERARRQLQLRCIHARVPAPHRDSPVREVMDRIQLRTGRRQRTPWMRCLAFVVAAIALASQLSSLAHHLLVAHAVCPRHGEWMHADELAAHESSTVDASQADALATWSALPTDNGHEHEHCAVVSDRRQSLAAQARSRIVSPAADVAHVAMGGPCEASTGSVPLLRLAPKNSPPV
jgi:hypothetical protein